MQLPANTRGSISGYAWILSRRLPTQQLDAEGDALNASLDKVSPVQHRRQPYANNSMLAITLPYSPRSIGPEPGFLDRA